jgi:YrbI family 3-deoxy-D-manno-octulosonate 8-phosphate phosphatase
MYYDMDEESKARLQKIKMVAFDVDGVLTDGGMYYGENGDCMKKFNARDGMAITKMREMGLKVAIITGEENAMVVKRAEKLKIEEVYMFARDKLKVAGEMVIKNGISFDELMYVGDDWLDVDLLQKAGFSCSPSDGLPWAHAAAHHVLSRKGGEGVAAEMLALLLSAR